MVIKNIELPDLDLFEVSEAEKWENAFENFYLKIENIPDNVKSSESIKMQCIATFELFNDIFGDGTDKKIFGDRVNLLDCLSAVDELRTAQDSIMEKSSQKINDLAKKYSINRLK